RKRIAIQLDDAGEVKLLQIFVDAFRPARRLFDAEQAFEQEKIGKNSGIMLAIVIHRFGDDRYSVHENFSRVGWVKTRHQLRKRGFSASVAANDEEQFTWLKCQVNRSELERSFAILMRTSEDHVPEFDQRRNPRRG